MRTAALALALTLTGCVSTPVASSDGVARARLGQTVYVDGPRVTPLEVLSDSRCPMNVRCVWAGEVKLRVRVHLGARSETHELTQGKPIHVADGSLELVEVQPDRVAGESFEAKAYRFGFRFMGGI